MLAMAVLGLLWGAVTGPYFAHSAGQLAFGKIALPGAVILGLWISMYLRRRREVPPGQRVTLVAMTYCFPLVAGYFWAFMHNPPTYSLGRMPALVFWAGGCGYSDDDLLVEADGELFSVRGRGVKGDLVALDPRLARFGIAKVDVTSAVGQVSKLCDVAGWLRSQMAARAARFPPDIHAWLKAFVVGDKSFLSRGMVTAFRDVGLLHVLVLSGGHLTVISAMFLFMIRVWFHIPYIFKKITAHTWVIVWSLSGVAVVVPLFLFCLMVGFSQSVQRAFFSTVVANIVSVTGFPQSTKARIVMTFFLQAVFYPANLLSLSMILSWAGSLLLMAVYESTYLRGVIWSMWQIFKIQLLFFCASLLFFGRAGILSPLVNGVGHTVFGILLPFNLMSMMLDLTWLDQIVTSVNRAALEAVYWCSNWQASFPVPFIAIPESFTINAPAGRAITAMVMSILFGLCGLKKTSQSRVSSFTRGKRTQP